MKQSKLSTAFTILEVHLEQNITGVIQYPTLDIHISEHSAHVSFSRDVINNPNIYKDTGEKDMDHPVYKVYIKHLKALGFLN